MTTQTELPDMPSTTANADATNRTLPEGATIVLEECTRPTRAGTRRFVQLRAYNGTKEVRTRVEDNVAPYNFKIYLDLACREIRRMCQAYSEKPLMLRRKPHSLQEFVCQMAALGMFRSLPCHHEMKITLHDEREC